MRAASSSSSGMVSMYCRSRNTPVGVAIAGRITPHRLLSKPTLLITRKTGTRMMVGGIFKEGGALTVVDCWGDDVPEGKLTSFPMAVQCQAGETVVFSWITWPSRQVRDEAFKKLMDDPRMNPETNPMPFDGKRMIYGGFQMIVST